MLAEIVIENLDLLQFQIFHLNAVNLVLTRNPDNFATFDVAVVALALQNGFRWLYLVWNTGEFLDLFEMLIEQKSIIGFGLENQEMATWCWNQVVKFYA